MAEDARDLRRRAQADPDAAADELCAALAETPGVALRRQEDLGGHLPLRVGGPCDVWAVVEDVEALAATLAAARSGGMTWRLCWPFEELVVRDGGLRGLVVRPGQGFEHSHLQAEDEHGPARLVLGSAAPWATASAARARAQHLAPEADALRGPLSEVGRWPGCPGGLFAHGDISGLEGLVSAVTWRKGRRTERVVVPAAGVPAPLPASAVLLSVEIPLSWQAGSRRLRTRHRPPAPGTLFADDPPVRAAEQLKLAGLLGTRMRAWCLAPERPGVVVNQDRDVATAHDLLLLAKGAREHVNRHRGALLDTRLDVIGVAGSRRR
ncbi:MAG: hypothetical protein H6742_15655 [Alphaproteobacteria bacterium]|nr:hypothetical protein [Alphaproteobacteria bacterium]